MMMMNHADKIEEEDMKYVNVIESVLKPGGYLSTQSRALELALSRPSGRAILSHTRDRISLSLFLTI
jgi:hypothetical protein